MTRSEPTARRPVVVMGVSGCGKSTVATELAHALDAPTADADALHPAANIAKMSSGHPLDDADRAGWLIRVGDWLATHPGGVIACSALRRRYRDVIRSRCPTVVFVYLQGSREVITARQAARTGHFMPTSLMNSQFDTLEPLAPDEPGITVDVDASIDDVVANALTGLRNLR
ncbi:gluconokinase [Gordonia jinhuaensis]|uniref:gluconokinase n=1 Tax=Gordonia jinhuaensis TaxID=1517702 RepID=UPI0016694E54|nr:gluconokinase [Gordonia jinhuaensis]